MKIECFLSSFSFVTPCPSLIPFCIFRLRNLFFELLFGECCKLISLIEIIDMDTCDPVASNPSVFTLNIC